MKLLGALLVLLFVAGGPDQSKNDSKKLLNEGLLGLIEWGLERGP